MSTESDLTPLQRFFMTIAGVISVGGIGILLSTQVDMRDPFVAGVYLVSCLFIILALRRYVKTNIRGSTPSEVLENLGVPPWRK